MNALLEIVLRGFLVNDAHVEEEPAAPLSTPVTVPPQFEACFECGFTITAINGDRETFEFRISLLRNHFLFSNRRNW